MTPTRILWLAPVLAAFVGLCAVFDAESVHAIGASALILGVTAVVLVRRTRGRPTGEWWFSLMVLAIVERLAGGLAHLFIGMKIYGGRVDFVATHATAVDVGPKFFTDPLGLVESLFTADILRLFYGVLYLLTGPGIVGMFFVSGLIGFAGACLFVRAYQIAVGSLAGRRFLALTLFLMPTFAFWASILGKDSWIFLLLGGATYAVARLTQGPRLLHVVLLGVSLYLITMLRPPAGAVMVMVVMASWIITGDATRGPAAILQPLKVVGVIVLAGFVVVAAAKFALRDYGIEQVGSLTDALAPIASHAQSGLGAGEGGLEATGSSLTVRITTPSLGQVLRFLPEGIVTFLFRPFPFEAHNPLALMASLEAGFFFVLVLMRFRILVRNARTFREHRFFCYCTLAAMMLTLLFGFERNFGVIVRHRSMALPFLLMLMAAPVAVAERAPAPRPSEVPVA